MAELVPFRPNIPNFVGLAQLKQRKDVMDAELQNQQSMRKQAAQKRGLQLISSATDDQTLGMAIQQHAREFPEMAQETISNMQQLFPQGYDEERKNQLTQFLLTQQEQFSQQMQTVGAAQDQQNINLRSQELDLKNRQFEHNKTNPKEGTPSPLGKLIDEMNALPEGDPNRDVYSQAIAKNISKSGGVSMTTNPDGTATITMGGTGQQIGKATANAVEKKEFQASNTLVRLNEIEDSLNEDFLTASGKFDFARLTALEKIAPNALTDDDRQFIDDASSFYTIALENLNRTLNELSGAAVSVQEFERISQSLPNPGKKGFLNIMSGDSRTEFISKLSTAIKRSKMAVARYNYISKHGFDLGTRFEMDKDGNTVGFLDAGGKYIPLDGMPKIMNKRANEIGQRIIAEGNEKDIDKVREMVAEQVANEFGLVY